MEMVSRLRFAITMVVLCFFLSVTVASAGDEVLFSGVVKKIIKKKNKVAIKDPATKKRFTVVITDETQPDGLNTLEKLKKKDGVNGKYTVTDKGLYIALELVKK
ncbi:MAG: hypothetical protein VW455_03375 [Nitrospinota bacterium]